MQQWRIGFPGEAHGVVEEKERSDTKARSKWKLYFNSPLILFLQKFWKAEKKHFKEKMGGKSGDIHGYRK